MKLEKERDSGRSLTYRANRSGPKTLPWETPNDTRIWEFFHDEGKVALEKDELMRAVKCRRMEGADNLSMGLDMWSGSVLLV